MKVQCKMRVRQQHRETKGERIDVMEDEGKRSKKRDYRSQEGQIDFKNVMRPEKKRRLEWNLKIQIVLRWRKPVDNGLSFLNEDHILEL